MKLRGPQVRDLLCCAFGGFLFSRFTPGPIPGTRDRNLDIDKEVRLWEQ